jgi:hypothetical protein
VGGQADVGQLCVQASTEPLIGSVRTKVFKKDIELPLLVPGDSKHGSKRPDEH